MAFIGKKPAAAPLTSSDVADGIITSAKIADGTIVNADVNASAAIAGSKLSGAGISVADQWRLTTTFTGDANPIASNWEQVDYTAGLQGTLGSAMTQSSGIFTFPSTGIYLVTFFANFALNENDRSISAYIEATTDNSTYQSTAVNTAFIQQTDSNWTGSMASTLALVDVIDTANDKVAFRIDGQDSNTQVQGNSNETTTGATFIRLGDT